MATAAGARVFIEGIALWSARLPGWDAARPILRGEAIPAVAPAPRPAPALLAPTERRRAPDSVAIALEVASAACSSAGRPAGTLASVFASTFGDTAVSDYLCSQLARAPLDTSPTKFHNSVHNAAAGYWAIATGCSQPYTAITAHQHTFGAGLAIACTHALAAEAAVLYVAYDIETPGPLATMSSSRGVLGAALVLAPAPSPRALARLDVHIEEGEARATPARAANAALVEGNAMSSCLALFEVLAETLPVRADRAGAPRREVVLTLAPRLLLRLEIAAVS
ncbi:MAG: beta-ketoacyl synthase chain length factor [Steroidobacteraceae bacterium]